MSDIITITDEEIKKAVRSNRLIRFVRKVNLGKTDKVFNSEVEAWWNSNYEQIVPFLTGDYSNWGRLQEVLKRREALLEVVRRSPYDLFWNTYSSGTVRNGSGVDRLIGVENMIRYGRAALSYIGLDDADMAYPRLYLGFRGDNWVDGVPTLTQQLDEMTRENLNRMQRIVNGVADGDLKSALMSAWAAAEVTRGVCRLKHLFGLSHVDQGTVQPLRVRPDHPVLDSIDDLVRQVETAVADEEDVVAANVALRLAWAIRERYDELKNHAQTDSVA